MKYKRKLLKLECIETGKKNKRGKSRSCFIKGKRYCLNIETGILHDDSRDGYWGLHPGKIINSGIDYINFFMWDWAECAKFKIIK